MIPNTNIGADGIQQGDTSLLPLFIQSLSGAQRMAHRLIGRSQFPEVVDLVRVAQPKQRSVLGPPGRVAARIIVKPVIFRDDLNQQEYRKVGQLVGDPEELVHR